MPPQIKQAKLETLEAIIKEVEGMKKKIEVAPSRESYEKWELRKLRNEHKHDYNQALSDLLTKLQASLTLLKNER